MSDIIRARSFNWTLARNDANPRGDVTPKLESLSMSSFEMRIDQ